MWQPISSAPFDCDVELSVCDGGQQHALIFPCRQFTGGWMNAETKRRVAVLFDTELRTLTEATAARLREIFATRKTPLAEYRLDRCRACSLIDLCRPKVSGRPARAWRDRSLAALLAREAL